MVVTPFSDRSSFGMICNRTTMFSGICQRLHRCPLCFLILSETVSYPLTILAHFQQLRTFSEVVSQALSHPFLAERMVKKLPKLKTRVARPNSYADDTSHYTMSPTFFGLLPEDFWWREFLRNMADFRGKEYAVNVQQALLRPHGGLSKSRSFDMIICNFFCARLPRWATKKGRRIS